MAETPRLSHFVALLLLGSGFCIFVSLLLAFYGAIRKRGLLRKLGGGGALLGIAGYAALLLGVGILSQPKILNPGQWKYFCEADCHIAYSIADVRTAATLGPEGTPVVATGMFVVVRVKTWFDEHSIASFRGDAPLTPNPRTVRLLDKEGHTYPPSLQAEEALGVSSTPLSKPLRPGEHYFSDFVFDVPRGSTNLLLLISDKDPLDSLIVDHENSPFHGKILLALWPSVTPSGVVSR